MEKRNSLAQLTELLTVCLITLFGGGLILCTKEVSAAAARAITLCARVVIPSLFPFLVLSSLCLSTGVGDRLSRLLARPIQQLFRLPGSCAPAIVLGLLGGYPIGARTAFALYDRRLCSREDCSRLLTFCSCCGPAFLLSTAGAALFGSLRAGWTLYICHAAAALIIGWVQGRFLPRPRASLPVNDSTAVRDLPRAFTQAVSSAFQSILNICAFVIFFAAVMAMTEALSLPERLQALLFFLPEGTGAPLLRGLMEMTGGIAALAEPPALPLPMAMAVAGLLAGWGGLSIHAQVLSLREDRDIPMGRYFMGKAFHGLLAAAMSYAAAFLCLIHTDAHSAFSPDYALGTAVPVSPMYFILVCGVYLAACLAVTALVVWLEDRDMRKEGCKKPKKTL